MRSRPSANGVWTLKNENRVSFTVRLNLNNPRHHLAWEKLRSGSGSYTVAIVDALTKEAALGSGLPDADALKAIMRQAISEAMRELSLAIQPGSASEETGGQVEMADEDFDIADGFMSALGC